VIVDVYNYDSRAARKIGSNARLFGKLRRTAYAKHDDTSYSGIAGYRDKATFGSVSNVRNGSTSARVKETKKRKKNPGASGKNPAGKRGSQIAEQKVPRK